jgi:Family of unknown function (DUF6221)
MGDSTGALVAFYAARLDEDEQQARYALERLSACTGVQLSDPEDGGNIGHMVAYSFHARRHNPARVLREIEAGRRLIGRYERAAATPASVVSFIRGQDDGYREACLDEIGERAAVYDAHPDYRPEWKPDA